MIIKKETRVSGAQTTKRKTKVESLDLNNQAKRHTRLERFLTIIVKKYSQKVRTFYKVMSILQEAKRKRVTAQTITLEYFVSVDFDERTLTKNENKDIRK
mgnify:CR=1 FL=1|jgi:hypothetical protein|tara:strand:- start:447 stop:746 length:300 start_codon:yes stop_codon:yes gene_type:complete